VLLGFSPRSTSRSKFDFGFAEAAKRNGVTSFCAIVEEYDLATTAQHQPRVRQIKTKG